MYCIAVLCEDLVLDGDLVQRERKTSHNETNFVNSVARTYEPIDADRKFSP